MFELILIVMVIIAGVIAMMAALKEPKKQLSTFGSSELAIEEYKKAYKGYLDYMLTSRRIES